MSLGLVDEREMGGLIVGTSPRIGVRTEGIG